MFGNRKRRTSSNPPINSNVSASAATAAAQAFLSSRASNTSLSSAAAAAALRSRPTTPTSVADIQTKRTIRRNGSTSSAGSSVGGSVRGPPGSALVRRGSSGSMTERTFRDPSPSRSSPVPSAHDAPPVPAIPKDINTAGGKSSRRSASMDAPGLRIASPPPTKPGGRGSSLGPSATASLGMGPRNPSVSSVSGMNGESRGVNPRIVSPNNQNLVYDPNTRRFLPLADILAIEQRLNGIANAPVKKKKKTPSAQGTHLAAGTVGGRIKGTAVDAMEKTSNTPTTPTVQQSISQPTRQSIPQATQQSISKPISKNTTIPKSPSAQVESPWEDSEARPVSESYTQQASPVTAPPKKKKKRVIINDSDSDQASILPNSSADESDASSQTYDYKTRAGALLVKKPSVVREDREREEEEDDSPLRRGQGGLSANWNEPPRTISPSPLPQSAAGRGHGRAQPPANSEELQHTRSASQPPMTSVPAPIINEQSPRGGRVQSVSPARTPHFMATPETLMVRHQPPARSVSPRKSALKHSSVSSVELRGPSPSDGASLRPSEASNDEDQPRKKGNRVSFDDGGNMVLGQSTAIASDSPVAASPQTKRGWFNLGRGKKKDMPATDDDDDDEVMKPRPALPSFGSVRERKNPRETEERPLVRPSKPVDTVAPVKAPASPRPASQMGDMSEVSMGKSNDHVAGAVIAQDATSKNAANISKSREPLPPDVTSVEGSGQLSDASSTYSMDTNTIGIARSNSVKVGPEDGNVDTYRDLASPTKDQFDDHDMYENIPEISVQIPSPNPEITKSREWLDIPGGFPNSNGSSSTSEDQTKDEGFHIDNESGPVGSATIKESKTDDSNIPEFDDNTRENSAIHPTPIFEESEEGSENESIYSDAAEEFDETNDGGFMSLDAVVESPVMKPAVLASDASIPDSPTARSTKERALMSSQLQRKSSEPDPEEGWEKAQQYWTNLSVDRKKQLELEAQRDADAEGDTEEEEKPAPKLKKAKKKSVTIESPISPIMQTMQASSLPVVDRQGNNERNYMVQPGSKAGPNGHVQTTMRSSLRSEPPHAESDVQMRKSMRGPGSTKEAIQNGTLQKKQRPASLPVGEIRSSSQAENQHLRLIQGAVATASSPRSQRRIPTVTPTPLRRKSSGDSDTSFKRARPAAEGISMRRSMRRGSETSNNGRQQSPLSSSRFSLRSASPGGPPSVTMRGTMRSSLKNSNESTSRAKSPIQIPSFGRSSSTKPGQKSKSTPRASRFADSSDEDEPRPGFRSRFVDSSDDDEPTPTVARPISSRGTPLRSIPRPAGYQDGDSSDLPDSDDESRPPTAKSIKKSQQNGIRPSSRNKAQASGDLQRSGSGREMLKVVNSQGAIATSPVGPTHARRGSILSIFRKKPDASSKVRKYNGESPARRDTPLERSRSDLEAIKRQDSLGNPLSPKLLKKNPKQNSGSWPLPGEKDDIGLKAPFEEGRPYSADTAGGVVGGENKEVILDARPDVGNRRFTATGLSDVDIMAHAGQRKKKKFHALRKMFRLDD
ncbi:e7901756-0c50-4210-a063-7ef9ba280b66 [Sclerotinia trifoliorum]|uniref:E7901756-0c50-4210-a063-7ef9ba280b66 n=1 Tax=Sclerotinia trifoliorum TaxID=28548 RepID=A0A8H2VTJ2_9HELO|nr:e7901756-0c50-4210-a063-7ef9ba280b66 [Sclerotinia trifoliorum]